jgi:hypothetical protein
MAQDHRRPGITRSGAGRVPAGHRPPARLLDGPVRRSPKPVQGADNADPGDLHPHRDRGRPIAADRAEAPGGVQSLSLLLGRPGGGVLSRRCSDTWAHPPLTQSGDASFALTTKSRSEEASP